MMLEISFAPSSPPVTAVIETSPEISVPALVMNCLAPSITHSPSCRRARVRTLPASEPASGSVRPNAPSSSAERDEQPYAIPGAARLRVLAAEVPGRPGDVDVHPWGVADEAEQELGADDRARLADLDRVHDVRVGALDQFGRLFVQGQPPDD